MAMSEIQMKNKLLFDGISDIITDMSDKFEIESLETQYLDKNLDRVVQISR